MKDFFKEMFGYHHHYNQLLADKVIEHKARLAEDTYKVFCHILNAQQVWNSRILSQPSFKVWQLHEPRQLRAIDAGNHHTTLRILEEVDLDSSIAYTNSNGGQFSNTVRDILFHAGNHATYHRGQLASQFKAAGIAPEVTDYIFYKR